MGIVSRIMGTPTTNSYAGYAPSADAPAFDVQQPGALGTDSYVPVNYRVPTDVPTILPAAVTAFRSMETMAPKIDTRQVTQYKEVPVQAPVRPRRAPKPAPVEAEGAATEQAAETQAATRTAKQTATETGEVEAATKTVRTTKTKVSATPKITTAGFLSAVKSSAVVSGVISLLFNGYSVLKGQESAAEGGANVVGDVAAGAVGGAGGVAASAFGAPMIASALGIAGGFPLTALSFGLGIGGYWLADKVFRNTSLFKSLKQDVYNLFSGNAGAVTAQPDAAYGTAYGANYGADVGQYQP